LLENRRVRARFLLDIPQIGRVAVNKEIGSEHLAEKSGKRVAAPDELNRGAERILKFAEGAETAIKRSESKPLTDHKSARQLSPRRAAR
jgi:hypothetical protein